MDGTARASLIDLIANLRDTGSSIVLATHDEHLRAALADRVLRVSNGKVRAT
jgi:ABC-type ATPase involved in cell division